MDIEISKVVNDVITNVIINDIKYIKGEEKPGTIVEFLRNNYNINESDISIVEHARDSRKYIIKFMNKEIEYIISDSENFSPDCIVYYNDGSYLFCEITETGFRDSGNNVQFQRFTKFVLEIINNNNNNKLVYYLQNEEEKLKLERQTKVAMRSWKTCGIELMTNNKILQNIFNELEPYNILSEFIKDWNDNSRKAKIELLQDKNIIKIIDLNVLKDGKINNDPGIGKLLLVILTLCKLNAGEFHEIIIAEHNISKDIINNCKNKLILLLNCIRDNIINITFENIIIPYCEYNIEYFSHPSKSEKIVSIWEEIKLGKKNIFTNHARGELEKIKFLDKSYKIPNNVYTPDLIWIEDKEKTIYFVEAEGYSNHTKGEGQINSWKSGPKSLNTRKFFKDIFFGTPYENYSHKAYITLYDNDNKHKIEIKNLRHVKHILDINRNIITNDLVEYLDLN